MSDGNSISVTGDGKSPLPMPAFLAIIFDAAALALDAADSNPELVAVLPEEARIFLANAEPAVRSLLSVPVQRGLWPDAPVLGEPTQPRRKGRTGG